MSVSYGFNSASPRVSFHWYPVRCCCNPALIYGFLPVKSGPRKFTIHDNKGKPHDIMMRPLSQPFPGVTPREVEQRKDAIKDKPGELHLPFQRDVELAIFADDRPLEFWRSLRGFIEAAPDQETFPQEPILGLGKVHGNGRDSK